MHPPSKRNRTIGLGALLWFLFCTGTSIDIYLNPQQFRDYAAKEGATWTDRPVFNFRAIVHWLRTAPHPAPVHLDEIHTPRREQIRFTLNVFRCAGFAVVDCVAAAKRLRPVVSKFAAPTRRVRDLCEFSTT